MTQQTDRLDVVMEKLKPLGLKPNEMNWCGVLNRMFQRYLIMLPVQSGEHHEIAEFCCKAIREMAQHPETKMNRWLGYVQGRVISMGLTTVEKERNFTRPFFEALAALEASRAYLKLSGQKEGE